MLVQFLAAHSGLLCFIGALLSIVGGIWFLFVSYECDVQLARWTLLMPPLALLLVIRYPETCLRPFLVNLLGFIVLGTGWTFSSIGQATSTILN